MSFIVYILSNTKNFILNQFTWIGISFVINIVISLFIPFPYSLIVIVAVFILLGYYFSKKRILENRTIRRT